MSWPRNAIVPSVESIRRMIVRDIVVLPQPDSPTSPSVSPSATETVTSLTACTRATSRSSLRRPRAAASRRSLDGARLRVEPDLTGPDLAQLALLRSREPAPVQMRGARVRTRLERRHLHALRELVRAARPEVAALGPVPQRRRQARDRRQPLGPRPVDACDRAEQAPGVGVLRVVEDLVERP